MTGQDLYTYAENMLHWSFGERIIWLAIEAAVRRTCRAHPWTWLKRQVSITQADTATSGYLMPANMIDVIGPLVDSDDYVYTLIDRALLDALPSDQCRYYYFDARGVDPIVSGIGLSINPGDEGTKAISFSPALNPASYTGSYDGEWITMMDQNGNSFGTHEMASATALENTYYGDRISGGRYEVRPSFMRRLLMCDGDGDAVAATIPVNYWVYPYPIVYGNSTFPDHMEPAIRIAMEIEVTTETADKKGLGVRLALEKRFKEALSESLSSDGLPQMQDIPRDNRNYIRRMGWRD